MLCAPLQPALNPMATVSRRAWSPVGKGYYHWWSYRDAVGASNCFVNSNYTTVASNGQQVKSVASYLTGAVGLQYKSSSTGGPSLNTSAKTLDYTPNVTLATDGGHSFEIFGADRTLCLYLSGTPPGSGALGEMIGGEFNRGQFFINAFSGTYVYNSNGGFVAVSGINFAYPVFITQLWSGTVRLYSGATPTLVQTVTTAGTDIGGGEIRLGNFEAGFGSATMGVKALSCWLGTGGMSTSEMLNQSLYLQAQP